MKCVTCGKETPDNSNFCVYCGKKQAETCDCWVKKEPYNCGQEKCPGYRLFLMEKKSQA